MSVVLDFLLLAVPITLAILGTQRGIQREAVSLIGILLGALLAEWFAESWAITNAPRYNQDPLFLKALAADALLVFCAVFIGYGGALLLPSRRSMAKGSARFFGLLVGFANGLMLEGMLLRNVSAPDAIPERITLTRIGPFLVTKLPQLLLSAVFVGTIVVLVRLVMKLLLKIHKGPEKKEEPKKEAAKPAPEPPKPAPIKPPPVHTISDPILRDLLLHEESKTRQ